MISADYLVLATAAAIAAIPVSAQSTRDEVTRRAHDCLLNVNSSAYMTPICIAFRDGVVYARDNIAPPSRNFDLLWSTRDNLSEVGLGGPDTHLEIGAAEIFDAAEASSWVADLLDGDQTRSVVLTVNPDDGTLKTAPIETVPNTTILPDASILPNIQQVQ